MTRKERRVRRDRLRKNMNDHLKVDAHADLPEARDLRFAKASILTLLLAIVSLLIWSSLTPVNEIASGEGVIVTEFKVERVEHPTGGRVQAVDVAVGQRIPAGARLIAFDISTMDREVEKLSATLFVFELERARLDFVLQGRLPQDISLETVPQSREGLMFWTEQAQLEAQLDLIQAESRAITAQLVTLTEQRQNLKEEYALLSARLDRSLEAVQKGLISQNELERQQREALQGERAVLSLEAQIAQERNALELNRLRRVELLATRRHDAALRIADIESQMINVKLSIAELEARKNSANVVSTVAGSVMSLSALRANEVIAPGELIAEIIPEDSKILAEIEIPAGKIGSVERGMDVRVKVETFDFTRFGDLHGTVGDISPTSFENAAGVVVFKVTVVFDATAPSLAGQAIRPGMTVMADIVLDSKMVLTYLLKPLRLLKDRAFTEA
ncbi:MAG: HlyD family type I secretion periplasmic adaptor subunit [Pseudomonadota bacterium]